MDINDYNKQYNLALADDHSLLRVALKQALESEGPFLIDILATDGQDLIDKLSLSNGVDAVLLDINMPNIDGFQATKLIKARWSSITVIAFTIHDGDFIKQKFIENGGDYYLSKNLRIEEIIEDLIKILKT